MTLDDISTHICFDCSQDVIHSYNFREKVKSVDATTDFHSNVDEKLSSTTDNLLMEIEIVPYLEHSISTENVVVENKHQAGVLEDVSDEKPLPSTDNHL